nr:hypothetical protein [Klebsiella pneumoniae]
MHNYYFIFSQWAREGGNGGWVWWSYSSMMPGEKSTMYTSAAKVRRQKKP